MKRACTLRLELGDDLEEMTTKKKNGMGMGIGEAGGQGEDVVNEGKCIVQDA